MTVGKKVLLASGDGHVGTQTKDYRPYVDPQFRGDFDEYLKKHEWLWSPEKATSMLPWSLLDKMRAYDGGFIPGAGSPIAWDPHVRLKELDKSGIVAEVLVPDDQNTNDPPWGSGLATGTVAISTGEDYSAEWMQRGAQTYNRWLADFCSADPRRLHGCIILGTLENVDWAVQEVRRCYEAGLRTAVMLPLHYSLPLYHHPRYDPFWRVCEELDLSVNIHLSKGGPDWVGNTRQTIGLLWYVESTWYVQRPLWCAVYGGIFDRFPKLRFVFSETGAPWVRPLLDQMDAYLTYVPTFNNEANIQLKPSEYWERSCFLCHSGTHLVDRGSLEEGGLLDQVPNVIWGADVGHGEGFWPNVREHLKPVIEQLPEAKMRKFLGENLQRAYPGVGNLQDIAEKVGSTAEELGIAA